MNSQIKTTCPFKVWHIEPVTKNGILNLSLKPGSFSCGQSAHYFTEKFGGIDYLRA
jgi:hypothetical protein